MDLLDMLGSLSLHTMLNIFIFCISVATVMGVLHIALDD